MGAKGARGGSSSTSQEDGAASPCLLDGGLLLALLSVGRSWGSDPATAGVK